MSEWQQLNEQGLAALEEGMNQYPPNLPHEIAHIVRSAIAAYRNGDRDPELILFLATATAQACANVLRSKVFEWAQDGNRRLFS